MCHRTKLVRYLKIQFGTKRGMSFCFTIAEKLPGKKMLLAPCEIRTHDLQFTRLPLYPCANEASAWVPNDVMLASYTCVQKVF